MAFIRSSKPSSLHPQHKRSARLKWLACAALVICATVLTVSIWAAASQTDAPAMGGASSGQVVVEPGADPSPEELAAADYLAGRGHRVRLLRRDPASPDPQPDAQLDDDEFPTEIKTVGNLTGSDIAAGLSHRIREGLRQAPSVVVDAREQKNLTDAQIDEAMRRSVGAAEKQGRKVNRVRVIGPNGQDVIWDYTSPKS